MSGGFTPSKVADLLGKEPETTLKLKKVEFDSKGKGKTRIPFLNFQVLNTKSNRFDLPLIRDNGITFRFGVQDLNEVEKDRLEYVWDDKKKERKVRFSRADAPNMVDFMQAQVANIQTSYKRELADNAESIDKYFHRGDTPELASEKRDWPMKWRSTESYDPETKKKGPGNPHVDQDGKPDPRMEVRFKFAGNPDDKWPDKFPIESFRGRPQETEFLNYETVRLDGTKIIYDPLLIDGSAVTAWNLHKALPRGVKIHEMDFFFKSGGYSNFDGGSPFLHIWVTRCVVELPPPSDFNDNASPEEIEQIKAIMRARAAKAAAGGDNNTGDADNKQGGGDGAAAKNALLNNM